MTTFHMPCGPKGPVFCLFERSPAERKGSRVFRKGSFRKAGPSLRLGAFSSGFYFSLPAHPARRLPITILSTVRQITTQVKGCFPCRGPPR